MNESPVMAPAVSTPETEATAAVVVVHSLVHARAALAAAREQGRTVILLSAREAAAAVGPGWFREMLREAWADIGPAAAIAFLDCGARPGDALAALRAGVEGVIFTGRADVADKLAAMAAARGVTFRRERPVAALDLLECADPLAACRRVLVGH